MPAVADPIDIDVAHLVHLADGRVHRLGHVRYELVVEAVLPADDRDVRIDDCVALGQPDV